jgi:NAD(P)-dependent dehydrogenase (short-subunit alcohol dehydrogenase family)
MTNWTYVVTGANRGLGLELARQLSARGEQVVACARQPRQATALQALPVTVEELDVADAQSVSSFARRLGSAPVDVLVNNAGLGGSDEPLAEIDFDRMEQLFRVNALGPLRMAQALLPNLRAGRRKLVASMSSRMGSIDDNSSGGYHGYRASKAALNMITKSLSIDLAREGFTCVVLHPGWVATEMGGTGAPLSAERSVQSLLRVLDRIQRRDSGKFFDHTGAVIPW